MNLSIQSRVSAFLIFESKTITMLLGLIGMFLGLGFFIGDSSSEDYLPLLALLDAESWGVVFLFYSTLKFSQILTKIHCRIKVFNSTMGMWLWTYILISFLFYDNKPISPAEILLAIPLVCEVIELVVDLFHHKRTGSLKKESSR